jgi:hypothetical protein
MKKKVFNQTIELEWKEPIESIKFEGDDAWGADEKGKVCSLLLTLSGKGETGSDILNPRDVKMPSIGKKIPAKIEMKRYYSESQRQYFVEDNILFDYRLTASKFDLTVLELKKLNDNAVAYFDDNDELKFLLLINILSFDFYFNSPEDSALNLYILSPSLRNQLWIFYVNSCLYQYDCQLHEYESAIRFGEELLKKEGLTENTFEFIKSNIVFWKEIVEDEYSSL